MARKANAKVRWLERESAWFLVIHASGGRSMKRYGVTKADRKKAEDYAAKLNRDFAVGVTLEDIRRKESGLVPEPEETALPFDVYSLEWLRTQVDLPIERKLQTALAPATAELHERHVRLYLSPFYGSRDVRSLKVPDVQALYDQCLEKQEPPSERSVEMVLATLRRILAYAEAREEIPRNPVEKWKRALGKKRRGQLEESDGEAEGTVSRENVLSWAELESLLGTARTDYPGAYPLLAFMADTGCRLGEATALRWVDVDLEGGVARIARSYSSGRHLSKTKTGKARPVELSARVRAALAAERPHIYGPRALAFPNEEGGFLNPHNFRGRTFRKLVEKVLGEGRRFTPHGLRHSFASLHLARGTNLKWVQTQGGWASATVLLDTYSHFIPSESAGFADAISEKPIRRETAMEANSKPEATAEAQEAEPLPQREIA